jgi:hypothetical protein
LTPFTKSIEIPLLDVNSQIRTKITKESKKSRIRPFRSPPL